jgi:uncharacterized protein YcbX
MSNRILALIMSSLLFLSQLYHYPLKSARGLALQSGQIHPLGLEQDRRWVLVDDQGVFLSQRRCPQMGAIAVEARGLTLDLSFQGHTMVASANPLDVQQASVWDDEVAGCYRVQPEIDDWLSAALGQAVRLLYFPDHATRIVDEHYAGQGHRTAFSDGFPLLVLSQSSLDALSKQWGSPINPRRFRPNLIIGGDCAPFSEDHWRRVYIDDPVQGTTVLELVKPCSRCVIPSLDPDTQASTEGFLRFLAAQRRGADGKVYLGQNAVLWRPTADRTPAVQPDRHQEEFTADAESQLQSLAETECLLHTKKEHAKDIEDFAAFRAPIVRLGSRVWVE